MRMSRRHTVQSGESPVHDISRARMLQGLKNLHSPFTLYEKCGHNHALNDPLAQEIAGLGMVCDEGAMDTICTHCCTDLVSGEYVVRETCLDEHKHLPGYALCPTLAIVEGREAPWRP